VSFRKQRTNYSCGAASLRYALTFLGTPFEEGDLMRWSKTTKRGTDEDGIARAARRSGCVAVMRTFRSFPVAFRHLMRYVQSGQPCILCVDGWKHWVTVAGASRKGVVLFDPGRQGVATLVQTARLKNRWRHIDNPEDGREAYFFIALRPSEGGRRSPRVVGGMKKEIVMELRKRDELRQGWNQYLQDLSDIFDCRKVRSPSTLPAWRFIRRHMETLVELVSFWDGALPKTFYRKELQNLASVARVHGFRLHPEEEKSALISLACILSHQTPAA